LNGLKTDLDDDGILLGNGVSSSNGPLYDGSSNEQCDEFDEDLLGFDFDSFANNHQQQQYQQQMNNNQSQQQQQQQSIHSYLMTDPSKDLKVINSGISNFYRKNHHVRTASKESILSISSINNNNSNDNINNNSNCYNIHMFDNCSMDSPLVNELHFVGQIDYTCAIHVCILNLTYLL